METLIKDSIDQKRNLDKEILAAYAEYYGKEQKWLTSLHAGKTIQDLINEACDKLEKSGCDLNKTSVETVIQKILSDVSIEYSIPQDFKDLQKALVDSREVLDAFLSLNIENKTFEIILINSINSIENKIKQMLQQ